MKYYICCRRGCPRRSLDSATIYNYLKLNNLQPTNKISLADIFVVYTCGGFQRSEDRSLATIKKIKQRKKQDAVIVVTGCLLKINPPSQDGESIFHVEHENLAKLDDIIGAKVRYQSVPDANIVTDINDLAGDGVTIKSAILRFHPSLNYARKAVKFVKRKSPFSQGSTGEFAADVYNIKIAHGCLSKCSYCAIKLATGKLHSKPIDRIFHEFNTGLSLGYERFVLQAEDIGCYGLDINTNIVHLLEKLFTVQNEFSLILNDFNPRWFIKFYDSLLPLLVANIHNIEDIRLPIQSGSDNILKRMRRGYNISDIKRIISDLNIKLPELKIHTHILVGFPGESERDFEESLELFQDLDFESVSVYSYEERPKTEACAIGDKVPFSTKMKRKKKLEEMFSKIVAIDEYEDTQNKRSAEIK